MSFHGALIALYQALGYPKKGGLCFGSTFRWLEADLSGEEELFHSRIKLIQDTTATTEAISLAKAIKGVGLTDKDNQLLELLSFFDSLELYHNPSEYSSLLNAYYSQNDFVAISSFASSDGIMSLGGIKSLYSESVACTEPELSEYLEHLGQCIEACYPEKTRIGLLLYGIFHTIAVTFYPYQGWKFMDINLYPSRFFERKNTLHLAEEITKGLKYSQSSAFTLSLVTTGNDPYQAALQKELGSLKFSPALPNESMAGLAYVAARYGHVSVIAELAKHQVNFNTPQHDGATPVYTSRQ